MHLFFSQKCSGNGSKQLQHSLLLSMHLNILWFTRNVLTKEEAKQQENQLL